MRPIPGNILLYSVHVRLKLGHCSHADRVQRSSKVFTIPTDAQVAAAAREIVITAMRESNGAQEATFYNASMDSGFWSNVERHLNDVTAQTGMAYDRLMAEINRNFEDDDGDNTINLNDELKGWNDGVFKSRADNGQILAEVIDGYWKLFDSSGNSISSFLKVTGVTFTDAGSGFTVGVGQGGPTFSFVGGDSTKFDLVPVDPPAGI